MLGGEDAGERPDGRQDQYGGGAPVGGEELEHRVQHDRAQGECPGEREQSCGGEGRRSGETTDDGGGGEHEQIRERHHHSTDEHPAQPCGDGAPGPPPGSAAAGTALTDVHQGEQQRRGGPGEAGRPHHGSRDQAVPPGRGSGGPDDHDLHGPERQAEQRDDPCSRAWPAADLGQQHPAHRTAAHRTALRVTASRVSVRVK
ncbi:hypothetical protein SDC9_123581 [bioreactor metagenome]|uniref:Uncharacterized protein n=1 Tax=bioreactor metagenome TaxID=1076179 RepID=A0A645CIE4_9ZZZZ